MRIRQEVQENRLRKYSNDSADTHRQFTHADYPYLQTASRVPALEYEPAFYRRRRTLPHVFTMRSTPARGQVQPDQAARVLLLTFKSSSSHEKSDFSVQPLCSLCLCGGLEEVFHEESLSGPSSLR